MALSNILVEPRREIVETAIGVATVGGYIAVDYTIARLIRWPDDPLWFVMFVVFVLTIVAVALLFVAHAIGEMISNWLGRQGYDPRPAQRYSSNRRRNDWDDD
jgi:hypothetical protein